MGCLWYLYDLVFLRLSFQRIITNSEIVSKQTPISDFAYNCCTSKTEARQTKWNAWRHHGFSRELCRRRGGNNAFGMSNRYRNGFLLKKNNVCKWSRVHTTCSAAKVWSKAHDFRSNILLGGLNGPLKALHGRINQLRERWLWCNHRRMAESLFSRYTETSFRWGGVRLSKYGSKCEPTE